MNKKSIIITGGSSGLGLELARQYAQQGHNLGLVARNADKLQQAADELAALSPQSRVEVFSADVTDEAATQAAIQYFIEEFGGLDILINSAGILREGRFEELPLQSFRDVMEINLFGTIIVCKAALPHLKESRGQLVNIASMAAHTGVFGYTPYTASKHALAGFTESLRYEMEPQGVTVQLICPPEFDSPMVDELNLDRTPENRAHTHMIPVSPVDAIARETIRAIERGNYHTVTGLPAKLVAFSVRHFPRLTRWSADRIIRKAQARPH